ncbi:LysR substrate-binding domain-containing protein [Paenibacillus gyeongsangnamensis]|uniref:LysR substrate-binding domain-containing protein n=1 Tax=Paenibacillus gyeongsangnamensis TaxID=3388067 RepID=UPI00390838C5
MTNQVGSVCKSVGFVPKYVYEEDEPAKLSTLVEAGIGIAFMPGKARNSREQIKYLQVDNHELERQIALLWHRSRYISRAALEFREVVVEYFRALGNRN